MLQSNFEYLKNIPPRCLCRESKRLAQLENTLAQLRQYHNPRKAGQIKRLVAQISDFLLMVN